MNRNHHDHLDAAGKDMWSRLSDLADKADMLYEREGISKDRKSVSEEEEEKKTRFSILVDLVGRLCDQEERRTLGSSPTKTNTLFEGSEKSHLDHHLDHLPQKPRSSLECFFTRVYTRRNHNNVSTSSSLFNTDEFERTETKSPTIRNSQSSPSSCLMENTKRKRYQSSGKSKKPKFDPFSLTAARETPEWLLDVMRKMKGAEGPIKLIYEKTLTATDVKPSESRLLIPFNKLLRNDFLTPEESRAIAIDKEEEEEDDTKKIGVKTIIVNQFSKEWSLRFLIWVMKKKKSGNGTLYYTLNRGWNGVVSGNKLKANDNISLWTFRCGGVLCFALEKE
ncbi:hypothetical protein ISN44_As03g041010 [Arabidopsis suecica]|uniref:TF-B3 domain-containing protein n=1 Tax=Arabidopsis suecica TaxID=45249 RepID=A0A8T2FEK7_ARASU|nr:hypothetical protein ISN44_As03g041010 [Arabidopsis suecica]